MPLERTTSQLQSNAPYYFNITFGDSRAAGDVYIAPDWVTVEIYCTW